MILDLDTFQPVIKDVFHPILQQHKISLKVLRLDLVNPLTGGNKWFKLKYNLEEAKKLGKTTLLSFGGPYSNHIAALASIGKEQGLKTVGIIRGELHHHNPTLNRAKENGMHLVPCGFEEYRSYRNPKNWTELNIQYPDAFIIPEGGSNKLGLEGCKLIAKLIPENTIHVFLPVGTGTTMAGLICGSEGRFLINGVAVVKAKEYFDIEICKMIQDDCIGKDDPLPTNYFLHHDFTFGGYAKKDTLLTGFIDEFGGENLLPIEPIYTGKMFYALINLVSNGYFKQGDSIVAIHTGGNQYLMS